MPRYVGGRRPILAGGGLLLGAPRRWVSITPYLPPTHRDERFEELDQVAGQVIWECQLRGMTSPREIGLLEGIPIADALLDRRHLSRDGAKGVALRCCGAICRGGNAAGRCGSISRKRLEARWPWAMDAILDSGCSSRLVRHDRRERRLGFERARAQRGSGLFAARTGLVAAACISADKLSLTAPRSGGRLAELRSFCLFDPHATPLAVVPHAGARI